jgi:uncharacterized protein GlcG (DUF336 family)
MQMPHVIRRDQVSYAAARALVDVGLAKAEQLSLRVSICVTDASGGAIVVARMDGIQASTVNAARGKATYSARSGRTTQDFIEARLQDDEVLFKAVSKDPDTFLVPGGFPLLVDGQSVGGVGVSGGLYAEDVVVAETAAASFHAAVAADGEV